MLFKVVKLEGQERYRVHGFVSRYIRFGWRVRKAEPSWQWVKTYDEGGWGDGPSWCWTTFPSHHSACLAIKRSDVERQRVADEKADRWLDSGPCGR